MEGGEPAYRDARKRPGVWTIMAHGGPQGVVEWQLAMVVMAEEPGPDVEALANSS